MKTVTAREANQQFSRLLGEVAEGEEVVITRRGQPVATLAPYRGRPTTPERKAAIERLMAFARKGFHLGGIRAPREVSLGVPTFSCILSMSMPVSATKSSGPGVPRQRLGLLPDAAVAGRVLPRRHPQRQSCHARTQ